MPIRLVYLEEWGSDNQDEELIKSIIDDSKIRVQPLFQEEITMTTQFKLEANANFDPSAKKDTGMERRANMFKYKSKFVANKCDVDEENNIYLQDKEVPVMMYDDSNKLALFHIYSPYAKEYYDNGLSLPPSLKKEYEETTSSNDVWADFFDDNIVKMEGRMIHRKELLQVVKSMGGEFEYKRFCDIKKAFNVRGYKYDAQREIQKDGERKKGFMMGCRLKNE